VSPEARSYSAEELRVGLAAEFERPITEADVLAFAAGSGDANPLHVDAGYAAGTSYGGRLVHGAFQVGLASAMIGMHLPGKSVLLANLSARFPAPLYFPCHVRVRGEISSWNPATLTGQVKVSVIETARQTPTAEITLGFTLHDSLVPTAAEARTTPSGGSQGKPVVLVTGASGGLGAELVEALLADYDVLAMSRTTALPTELRQRSGVQGWACDLNDPATLRDQLPTVLAGRRLYGIVHAAWPSAPLGGLLQAQDDVLESQVLFGVTTTVRLARLLFEHVGPRGGRLVALSSIVASQKPVITLSSYSLGKSTLEHAIKLLAPELARRNVTVNAIGPAFIATGMNKHKSEQQRKIEASRIPLGRLCESRDVSAAVLYLLSEGAGFVSGQVLGLTGGQL
jgi:3-oxoacyl-[acyl-carrier protein] reductase